jgi:photosystem II stability/assembly factor-like uncharacterized protein
MCSGEDALSASRSVTAAAPDLLSPPLPARAKNRHKVNAAPREIDIHSRPVSVLSLDWTQTSAPTAEWDTIASSSTGKYLAAVIWESGIYTSSDYGSTWTQTAAPTLRWNSIASSNSGQRLVAVAVGSGIYTSSDYGSTWTKTSAPSATWNSIASSSTGQYVAAAAYVGGVYVSNDYGSNWLKPLPPMKAVGAPSRQAARVSI